MKTWLHATILFIALTTSLVSYANAGQEQELAQYFPDLPSEVKEHISHAENCQKNDATGPAWLSKSSKCNKVEFENSKLVNKYAKDTNVSESLRLTRELYFSAH